MNAKKSRTSSQLVNESQIYIQQIMAQPIQPRAYVLDKARKLAAARNIYLNNVMQMPHVLQRCAVFLKSAIDRKFRMDSGFDVSQRQSDLIQRIQEQLEPTYKQLISFIKDAEGLPFETITGRLSLRREHLIKSLLDLTIRIRHLNSWYTEGKQIYAEARRAGTECRALGRHVQAGEAYFARYVRCKEAWPAPRFGWSSRLLINLIRKRIR